MTSFAYRTHCAHTSQSPPKKTTSSILELAALACSPWRPYRHTQWKGPWPLFFSPLASPPPYRNIPWTPSPSSSLSFIYHIFCLTETLQRGSESHQPVTRHNHFPHRKLLIPAEMSRTLENCQTRWTQCCCESSIALLKIDPARRDTAENFIMLMWRVGQCVELRV